MVTECTGFSGVVDLSCEALNNGHEFANLDGLSDVSIETSSDSAYSILRSGISGKSNRRNVLTFPFELPDLFDQVISIRVCHADIANQQVKLLGSKKRECFRCRCDTTHLGAVLFKIDGEQIECVQLIFDHENTKRLKVGAGKVVFE